MEADHDQAPAGRERGNRLWQRALDLAELVVDVDAQRLERAGRRMSARLAPRHGRRDDAGEPAGRLDGAGLARADDRARDASGMALLAEARDHGRDLALVRARQEFGGSCARIRIHAHVEWTVAQEAEPAPSLVELRGGNAEVEEDSVGAARCDVLRELRESRAHEACTWVCVE